jgi:hypothetical protein
MVYTIVGLNSKILILIFSTNKATISKGIIERDLDAGTYFMYFTDPIQFTYSYNLIAENATDYHINYNCNNCADYGTSDLGSKYLLKPPGRK